MVSMVNNTQLHIWKLLRGVKSSLNNNKSISNTDLGVTTTFSWVCELVNTQPTNEDPLHKMLSTCM